MRQVILGHRGMVGSAIHRLIPDAIIGCSRDKVDLRYAPAVQRYMGPLLTGADVLYLCAARVGGIQRNISEPGSMLYDNLMIQANVIETARAEGVKLIVFLGSSCIYPSGMPIWDTGDPLSGRGWREDDLLGGPLEPTNEPYAIAKIAGIKMLDAYQRQYGMEFLAVMPCNLYGPGDNYDLETSHFIPGMIRRFHEAKVSGASSVTLWGTGRPRREIMHVDGCARIIVGLVARGARGVVNVGPGVDYAISFYAELVASATDYHGEIEWDESKPDGVMRKLLDVARMKAFGVERQIYPVQGFNSAYEAFLKEHACE